MVSPVIQKMCASKKLSSNVAVTLPGVILEIKGSFRKMQTGHHFIVKNLKGTSNLTTKPGAFLAWNNTSLHLYFKPVVTTINSPSLCFIITV